MGFSSNEQKENGQREKRRHNTDVTEGKQREDDRRSDEKSCCHTPLLSQILFFNVVSKVFPVLIHYIS